MNFPKPLLLTLLLSLLTLTTSTTLQTSTKPLRLIPRCRPSTLQRDALCACYTATIFGLIRPSFTRRCARFFRVNTRSMRRACNFYTVRTRTGPRIQSKRLVRNLSFIVSRCPKMLSRSGVQVKFSGRMLSNFEIRRRIDRVLMIIAQLLEALQPMPAVTNAPSRIVVTADQDDKRIARLRQYNDIPE